MNQHITNAPGSFPLDGDIDNWPSGHVRLQRAVPQPTFRPVVSCGPSVYPLRVSKTCLTNHARPHRISTISQRLRAYGFAASALAVICGLVTGPAFPAFAGKNASQGTT